MLPLTPLLFLALPVRALQDFRAADTTPPAFLVAPDFRPAPNPNTPLAARLIVSTNEPARAFVLADDGTRRWKVAAGDDLATAHDLALAGFRAGRTHTIHLVVEDAAGNSASWPLPFTFSTPALPAGFPPLHVATSTPASMEPGVTLVALQYASSTLPGPGAFVVYLDAAGEVVWLHAVTEPLGYGAIRLRNGHLVMNIGHYEVREIDLLGNVVARWWAARRTTAGMPAGAIPVDCDNFHHELDELPVGDAADFVTLAYEMRPFPNYPTSEVDPTQTTPVANVIGDEIVEFRRDGTIVRRKNLLDVLDPYRLCYGSLANIGLDIYGVTGHDWGHTNAVALDPADGDWIVSLRHQDAVVKMQRGSGAIRWILGPHERWNAPWSQWLLTPVGTPFEWQFHQHSPHVAAPGDIVLFDNGNYRVIPPAPWGPIDLFYSRAVRFHVDPVAHTIAQTWVYDGNGSSFFSPFFGDADPLPRTGNVLVADGWRKVAPTVNRTYSRIVEVTNASLPQVVFEVIVNDPAQSSDPYNWNIYRSQRYASLYP